MKRTTLLTSALAMAVVFALANPADAMRDPGGPAGPYADGMSLYEYARSVPVVRRDPTGRWTEVERIGKPRARVCSDSAQDTWQSLAETVKHDEEEYMLWAKEDNSAGNPVTGAPEVGKWYTVPNKVIVDIGTRRYGWWGAFKDSFHHAALAERALEKSRGYARSGFLVEQNLGSLPGTKDLILEHLRDPDLYAYGYGGHGSQWGSLTYGYTDKGKYFTPNAGRFVHHRLAEIWLFTCRSLSGGNRLKSRYAPETTGGRTSMEISEWELNVSRYGTLSGFVGKAYGWSDPESRPGGLREKPGSEDPWPEEVPDATFSSY